MQLEYLQTAQPGARWLRLYYRRNPQLNLQKTVASLRTAERTLRDNPFAGERFEEQVNVREYPIQGTAFSLLYTIARNTIWIIDIRDQRGHRSAEALRAFSRELSVKFDLLPRKDT